MSGTARFVGRGVGPLYGARDPSRRRGLRTPAIAEFARTSRPVPDWTRLSATVEGLSPFGRISANPSSVAGSWTCGRRSCGAPWLAASGHRRSPASRASARLRPRLLRRPAPADPSPSRTQPENYSATVSIDATIGSSLTERTATGITIALAVATRIVDPAARAAARWIWRHPHSLTVDLGRAYRLDRVVAVHTSRDPGDPDALARAHADRAMETGPAALIDNHRRAWMERWNACDLCIVGDPAAQRALRFATYHP